MIKELLNYDKTLENWRAGKEKRNNKINYYLTWRYDKICVLILIELVYK